MITKIKVGKLVKRLREKKLMEQKDLASNLEISQATLSNIENGKRKVYISPYSTGTIFKRIE